MDIVDLIKKEVIKVSDEYREQAEDKYDFWQQHIKYVYMEAIKLAEIYQADTEIVSLGALLHDIALIKKVGSREDHHINGKMIAKDILEKYRYPKDKMERVLSCVYNHRSSHNASNIEDLCVADADILAHFDNIPMLFNSGFKRNNINLYDINEWMMNTFEKDYYDLSDMTRELFKERYKLILEIVLGKYERNGDIDDIRRI